MPLTITHAFVSPVFDLEHRDEVGPAEWNDDHVVTGDVGDVPVTATGTTEPQLLADRFAMVIDSANYGATSDVELNLMFADAIASGRKVLIRKGDYSIAAQVMTVQADFDFDLEVECEPGARFTAAVGFPVTVPASRMFLIHAPNTSERQIRWTGGFFDGRNMPTTSGHDICSFNAPGGLILQDMEIEAGDDFDSAGADSCLYTGYCRWQELRRIRVRGANDAGIYVSGGSLGDGGNINADTGQVSKHILIDDIHADSCVVGVIVKRRWTRLSVGTVFATNCVHGLTVGSSAGTDDFALVAEGKDCSVGAVLANRCGTAFCIRDVVNAYIGTVIHRQVGCALGTPTTEGRGCVLEGGRNCVVGSVIVDGVNPSITAPEVIAVSLVRWSLADDSEAVADSTGNFFQSIIAKNISEAAPVGSIVDEDTNANHNTYIVTFQDTVGSSRYRIQGSASVVIERSTGGHISFDTPIVAMGGLIGDADYSLRVTRVASAVNYIQISGAGTGNPVTITAAGTDTDVDLKLTPQADGVVMINLANCDDFATEGAAAAGGVPIGGLYRTANALRIRVT